MGSTIFYRLCVPVVFIAVTSLIAVNYDVFFRPTTNQIGTIFVSLDVQITNEIGQCVRNASVCSCEARTNSDIQYYTFMYQINQKFYDWTVKGNLSKMIRVNLSNVAREVESMAHEKIVRRFAENYRVDENRTNFLFLQQKLTGMSLEGYDWEVSHRHCDDSGNGNDVIITIQETYNNESTSGGSSFTILQTSAHTKDFCPVIDLFNGTYIAKCQIHEENTEIVGNIHHVNLTGFTSVNNGFITEIFNISESPSVMKNSSSSSNQTEDKDSGAHWRLSNSTWRWFNGSSLTPKVDRVKLKKCAQQFSAITFMGDSHIRFLYYYVMLQLGNLPKSTPMTVHGNVPIGKTNNFKWTPFLNRLIWQLKKELFQITLEKKKNKNKKLKRLVVFNAIHWDISRQRTHRYLEEVPKLLGLMKTLLREKSARFVYLTSVVTRPTDKRVCVMRTLNMRTLRMMTTLGVEAVDVSTMLSSVPGSSPDGIHFLTVDPKTREIRGKFGPGMADAVIHHLCG